MRRVVSWSALACMLVTVPWLGACDGCEAKRKPTSEETTQLLASALRTPAPPPSGDGVQSIGHAANVLPGQGPRRIESATPRLGMAMPILPGQGIGPIRFGATKATIERLMGAACDDATDTLCRYVARAVEFKLDASGLVEIRVSRKGREAKRTPDGAILEYGFYNGAILPDLYFGMQPGALQESLGKPQKIESISPLGPDGFAERHIYDGLTLEYDLWSNGNLVLGAAVLTKNEKAAAATQQQLDEMDKKAAEMAEYARKHPIKKPR